jgi:hypothetical protein
MPLQLVLQATSLHCENSINVLLGDQSVHFFDGRAATDLSCFSIRLMKRHAFPGNEC